MQPGMNSAAANAQRTDDMNPATSPTGPTIAYIACARSNEIMVFAIRPTDGALALIQRVCVAAGITPLVIRPDRRVLYAGLRGETSAAISFAIDAATGELRPLDATPLTDPPMYLATDASGRFLLSASYAGATFTISAIASDGSVDPVPIQHTTTPPRAHGIRTDRTNRFLFVTALGADAILQYHFDYETGRATPNSVPFVATPPASGPRHLVFHPVDAVLYVNGELDAGICSYMLAPETGQLRPLGYERLLPASEPASPWAAELAITPDGQFLYASERRTSVLGTFDLRGEPGSLVSRGLIRTEERPRCFAIDPRGRWLVLAGELSNHVCVYAIDRETGALAAQQRYLVGEKPAWITIIEL
jgi:6-phosphogluconolactonase